MRHKASPCRWIALSCLAALTMGCAQGPFTRPANIVLYEDRSAKAPPPATPSRRDSAIPARHVVKTGDTVYAVANRYRVSTRTLIELNGLRAPYVLRGGRELRLPAPRRHIVQPGDTIYGVARKYGVAISTLVRLNRIEPPYTIVAGRNLRLPVKVQTAATPVARPIAAPEKRPGEPAAQPRRAAPKPAARVRAAVPKPPPRAGRTFLLPVRGKIISKFGSQGKGLRNDGINIAAALGTPVRAAENGIVVYSGNALLGFGNMVLIRHADGFMTAYAHNRSLDVKRGDVVRRGQVIAEVGRSGNVSTPQLHFEVRKGKTAVNPALYLPSLTT
jgi:murein DD-endopeptidase MepM/ murein hydrolase activator NlpD